MVGAEAGEGQPWLAVGVDEAVGGEVEVAFRVVLGVVHQQQVGERAVGAQAVGGGAQGGEVGVAEDVAVDDDEGRVAEQRQGVADAAGGLQRAGLGRPGDAHAEGCAVAERLFQPVAEVGVVDHQLAKAGIAQALDVPHDQRLATGLEQRLGAMVGQRAHALAAAGGEDHRFHRRALRRCSRR